MTDTQIPNHVVEGFKQKLDEHVDKLDQFIEHAQLALVHSVLEVRRKHSDLEENLSLILQDAKIRKEFLDLLAEELIKEEEVTLFSSLKFLLGAERSKKNLDTVAKIIITDFAKILEEDSKVNKTITTEYLVHPKTGVAIRLLTQLLSSDFGELLKHEFAEMFTEELRKE
ncbi:hypothetical protein HN587_03590 [Candidatus Woesearchaeota archaeon]|jgi:hypothetical protein|nr:hypothetical protein [Candidatus Woesearchaeota archaeon]